MDITACDNFTWDGVIYDVTGSYTNSYFDVNGCDSIVTLNLTINESPFVQIIYSAGDLLAFVTGGIAPFTFEWNTGATTQTITPSPTGVYWCVVTDSLGCISDTAYTVPLNVSEVNESIFRVYPNPVKDILNIDITLNNSQSVELKIVNVLGEVMYFDKINQSKLSYYNKFDFSKFSKGLYFVKLKLDKNIITKKVIFQ